MLKILIIDENLNSACELRNRISDAEKKNLYVELTSNIGDGVRFLSETPMDAILLSVPFTANDSEKNKEEILLVRELRRQIPASIPILVVSDLEDLNLAMESLRMGAEDYLVRNGLFGEEVLLRIGKGVERSYLHADWKASVDEHISLAFKDPLTTLPNRTLFQIHLGQALSEAKRKSELFAILFIDVDHFKQSNDKLGHEIGDKILETVSQRFLRTVRGGDSLARWGGDEFVLLVRHLKNAKEVETVAERLLKSLKNPIVVNHHKIILSASIGISVYPHDGHDLSDLLARADTTMYHVKKKGGGGYRFFSEPRNFFEKGETPMQHKPLSQEILIVEDDADIRDLFEKCFRKMGYSCTACDSVEKAIHSLETELPQLILLDLGFQSASGLALLQNLANRVKKGEETPPVLVISGYNDPEIVEYALTLGATGFLSKPIETKQLISSVRSLLH